MWFDADQEKEFGGFEPLPAGVYNLKIIDTDFKSYPKGNSRAAQVAMQVVDGEHKGRQLYNNYLVEHDSEKAVAFGRSELGALLRACGVPKLQSENDFLALPKTGKVFSAKIGVRRRRDDDSKFENHFTSYSEAQAARPATTKQEIPF